MSITVTAQNPITQDPRIGSPNGFYSAYERAPLPGDDPDMQYQKVQYSNGFQDYIKLELGADIINQEIQNTINAFDSVSPPQNWNPYAGYGS